MCISNKPKDWVFQIPRISSADFDELESFDVVSMRDVPNGFPLNPKQRRVVDVAKSGGVYRSPELTRILPPLAPPVSYLDFETFSPVIPIYLNTSPHQRIPFQWSWDRRAASVGAQSAMGRKPAEERVFRPTLLHLADRIGTRLRAKSRPGRTVTVHVRFANLNSATRSVTLDAPISATVILAEIAEELVRAVLADHPDEILFGTIVAMLNGAQFLNCTQLVVTRNRQSAFRDEALACGASIPNGRGSE
jgi:hypothetical protein